MIYVWAVLLVSVNAGFLVMTLFLLPGNWLMIAATVGMAIWQWEAGMFSVWTLVAIGVLAAGGEVVEFLTSAVAVRTSGGTRKGSIGALMGGLPGGVLGTFLIPIPVIGTLAGAALGAASGAYLFERWFGKRQRGESTRSGMAAGAGVFIGTVTKFILGCLIWLIIAVAAFWP
ncbi:MAG: DUF456 family protein [Planctomycetota bacterium]|jgi:hypothetical protein